jgi:hypothetical protein
MIGIPNPLKLVVKEGVKDGMAPAKIHRKLIEAEPNCKVTLCQVQARLMVVFVITALSRSQLIYISKRLTRI